jgi:hypothetical protein
MCCCAVGMLPFKRRKQRDLLDALTAPPQQSSRLATRSSDMFDSSGGGDVLGLQFRNASGGQTAISSLVPDEVIRWVCLLCARSQVEHHEHLQSCSYHPAHKQGEERIEPHGLFMPLLQSLRRSSAAASSRPGSAHSQAPSPRSQAPSPRANGTAEHPQHQPRSGASTPASASTPRSGDLRWQPFGAGDQRG